MSEGSGILFIITGTSGSGKDTIMNSVIRVLPGIRKAVTAVTREPRPGEVHGEDHFFLSATRFDDWLRDNRFVEWANVYGRRYGTPKSEITDHLLNGIDVILRVDVQGARAIMGVCESAVVIFVRPESIAAGLERLHIRDADGEMAVKLRVSTAKEELRFCEQADYVVENKTGCVNSAVEQVVGIIHSERKMRLIDSY
tara:strand:+ start:1602 stop:2195 length:594 start_codon:yes stop_codon:yes gene_type:complete